MKLYPRCHPFWFDGDKKLKLKSVQMIVNISEGSDGYILPCCMSDSIDKSDLRELGMLDEELSLTNSPNIKKIILSKQWINFHKILVETPEKAPKICKHFCGIKYESLIDDQQ